MTASLALTTRGLTKSYGPVRALWGVDLEVRPGEIFGFLGPNGSGKTTTIRCLLDLIRPSSGTVQRWDSPAGARDKDLAMPHDDGPHDRIRGKAAPTRCPCWIPSRP
jgi:ABC-type multidrug transport system ATPase subunit